MGRAMNLQWPTNPPDGLSAATIHHLVTYLECLAGGYEGRRRPSS